MLLWTWTLGCSGAPAPGVTDDPELTPLPTGDTAATPAPAELDPWIQPDTWVEPQSPAPGSMLTVHYAGDLADADTLTLHFGWNGWSDVDGYLWHQVGDDTFWFSEVLMTPGSDGVHTAQLEVPSDARALHYVVFDPGTGVWDNAENLDYHASIQFPVVGPYLLWTEAVGPDEGIVVAWETGVPCLGVVDYGETPELGRSAVGDVLDTVHAVALDDLTPGATLYYRVRDSGGNVSAVFETTLPDPASPSLRFAALSDMQDNGESQRWADVAVEVATHDPQLLLMPGDLPADDGPGQWWLFFDKARELFATTPIVPAVGNHDTPTVGHDPDTSSFQRRFPIAGQPWGAIDVGPVHFLLLSTETVEDLAVDATQYAFARDDLDACDADADRCAWTFAAFHVPPYNAGVRHGPEQGAVRDVTALFDSRVDWVVTGHEHLYQRVLPMRYNATFASSGAYGRGDTDGVGYLVLPPAGNWPEDRIQGETDADAHTRDRLAYPVPTAGSAVVGTEIGFALIEVDGESFSLQTIGLGSVETPEPAHVRDALDYQR